MKHIFLIRHGRQESKDCNVDVSLSPEGRMQSSLLAERLADKHFDKFYSSCLYRAAETADIINDYHDMVIERRSELNEIDYGFLTGTPDAELKVKWASLLELRQTRDRDVRFPGGENGEDVTVRARAVFREIEESDWENILIVTHGGLIRSLIPFLLGFDERHYLAFSRVLENTSITEFSYNEVHKRYTLERLNDYAHLLEHPELLRAKW